MSNVNLVCPRCGHRIPNDQTPGLYPGATSRVDNKTEVCSACGAHEGMQAFAAKTAEAVTPIEQWPVTVPEEFYHR